MEADDASRPEFREEVIRKPILEGVVVQWIVVCLCSSFGQVGRQLVATTSTFPEADKIVLIANGFGFNSQQLTELRSLVSSQSGAPVQVESTLNVTSPEQALLVAWEVLPPGAKVVAYCIKECEVRSLLLVQQYNTATTNIDSVAAAAALFINSTVPGTRYDTRQTKYCCMHTYSNKSACIGRRFKG